MTAPLVEFSKGTTPKAASPDWTVSKTSILPQSDRTEADYHRYVTSD